MSGKNELEIPPAATADANSMELLRVWVANKGQHVNLRVDVWKDPAAWGIMLHDLMLHIVNAYQQDEGRERGETYRRILLGFSAESESATDTPSGELQ